MIDSPYQRVGLFLRQIEANDHQSSQRMSNYSKFNLTNVMVQTQQRRTHTIVEQLNHFIIPAASHHHRRLCSPKAIKSPAIMRGFF
ncbi:MAG: hypothetical protein R3Y10_06750 [Ferrimonas sp.]